MKELLQLLNNHHIEQAEQWLEEHPGFFSQEPSMSFKLLSYALDMGQLDTVKVLLKHGADVNSVDAVGGITLLQSVARSFYANIDHASLLIDHGIDIHRTDLSGNTSLISAAAYGKPALTELLIRHGVDLDARGEDGLTAVMRAIRVGEQAVMMQLIDAGASLLLKAPHGENLLEFAESQGQYQIAHNLFSIFLAAQEKEALDAVTLEAVNAVTTSQKALSSASEGAVNLEQATPCEAIIDIKPHSLRL